MKKILALLLLLAVGPSAQAGVSCSVPFNLQNGTTADATQVMANYNALIACLANAAAAGANNDITSLSALSTPITPAQGGTNTYTGGTSAGSANAQTVTATPTGFSLTAGKQVTFIAGFTPTGAMTLNVNSSGAVNLFRRSQLGVSATVGGEFVAGQVVTVMYDGTQYQLISTPPVLVGEIRDYSGSSPPAGWAYIDGSCQNRTGVFADLFSLVGTNFGGGCGGAQFQLPDGRGRMLAGRDDMGGTPAGRITSAGSGCVGTTLGAGGCGTENVTISQGNLPSVNFTVTGSVTSVTWTNGVPKAITATQQVTHTTSDVQVLPVTGSGNTDVSGGTISGNAASGGSGTALVILNPLQIVNKIIKY